MLLDVRIPPSKCARSPSSAPGPYSASRSPPRSTRTMPSRTRRTSVPRLAFVEQDRAGREALDPALATTLHQLRRQGRLERRLHGGHQRLGVLVAPRAVLAERLAVPVLEVGEARLVRERVVGAVDPMPGEPAGSDQSVLRSSVRVECQRQRGPHQRGLPLYEGAPAHPSWRRDAGATAAGLDEPDPAVSPFRGALNVRQLHGLEAVAYRTEIDQCRAHEPAALVPAVDDPSVVHRDERTQLVGKAEPVLVPQSRQVHGFGRGRGVIVRDTRVERQALGTLDRFSRDPGERGDDTGVPGQPFCGHARQPLPEGVR